MFTKPNLTNAAIAGFQVGPGIAEVISEIALIPCCKADFLNDLPMPILQNRL